MDQVFRVIASFGSCGRAIGSYVSHRYAGTELDQSGRDSMAAMPLHDFAGESTYLIRLLPGLQLDQDCHPGGEEIYVLEGIFGDKDGTYPAGTWIRSSVRSTHSPYTEEGSILFIKEGLLRQNKLDAFKASCITAA